MFEQIILKNQKVAFLNFYQKMSQKWKLLNYKLKFKYEIPTQNYFIFNFFLY